MTLGFDIPTLAWIGLASLAAFVVRGLSGFGSAMIGIGALTLVLPPAQVIPAFFGLELLTTVNLLPSVWRRIDWRSLPWVIAGCAVTTPVGLTLLARLDPDPMRLVVSACLATIALLMLSGLAQRVTPRSTPGPLGALAVGGASGVLNGAAGIPGPPAIVFYFASTGMAVSRATLVAFFLFTDSYGLAWAGGAGLLGGRRVEADRGGAAVLPGRHLDRPASLREARRGAPPAPDLGAPGRPRRAGRRQRGDPDGALMRPVAWRPTERSLFSAGVQPASPCRRGERPVTPPVLRRR